MQKPAETQFPIHDLIRDRWSPLAFDSKPVEPEKLGSLLEAARWAASSYNEQPWAFFVGTKEDGSFDGLFNCLAEGNQPWAQEAPVLLLSVASEQFGRNGKPNRHAGHDVGMANANLVLQAMSMGLYCHMMAGFEPQKARHTLGIPEGWDPLTMMSVGYLGDVKTLPADLQKREGSLRSRKPLTDFVFTGKWGEAAKVASAE